MEHVEPGEPFPYEKWQEKQQVKKMKPAVRGSARRGSGEVECKKRREQGHEETKGREEPEREETRSGRKEEVREEREREAKGKSEVRGEESERSVEKITEEVIQSRGVEKGGAEGLGKKGEGNGEKGEKRMEERRAKWREWVEEEEGKKVNWEGTQEKREGNEEGIGEREKREEQRRREERSKILVLKEVRREGEGGSWAGRVEAAMKGAGGWTVWKSWKGGRGEITKVRVETTEGKVKILQGRGEIWERTGIRVEKDMTAKERANEGIIERKAREHMGKGEEIKMLEDGFECGGRRYRWKEWEGTWTEERMVDRRAIVEEEKKRRELKKMSLREKLRETKVERRVWTVLERSRAEEIRRAREEMEKLEEKMRGLKREWEAEKGKIEECREKEERLEKELEELESSKE